MSTPRSVLQQVARRVAVSALLAASVLALVLWGSASLQDADSGHPTSSLRDVNLLQLSQLHQTTQLDQETCDCSAPTPCVEVIETDIGQKLPGGGAAGLTGLDWGSWDPVTGVPRVDCPDTVTHAHYTRYKDKATGIEYVSPTNRFYGSTMFAPKGQGMSQRGYEEIQERDVLCTDLSGAVKTKDPLLAPKDHGCPDTCAYECCNCGQSYTVQCPDHCFQGAGVVYGSPETYGVLEPYEDTTAICRAAILSGKGTNDDSFYVTFTIVEPVRAYKDPGGGQIVFEKWDRVGDSKYAPYVSDKCCKGGWPPKLGFATNEILKWRKAFKNEWQNVRAFRIEGAVKNLCPTGFKYKRGTRQAGDPACVVNAQQVYTPVEGCDECVEDDGNNEMCGISMPSGNSCPCTGGLSPAPSPTTVTTTSEGGTSDGSGGGGSSGGGSSSGGGNSGQCGDGKVAICHATAAGTYNHICVMQNAVPAHQTHQNDIVPAPAEGCPETTGLAQTQGLSPAPSPPTILAPSPAPPSPPPPPTCNAGYVLSGESCTACESGKHKQGAGSGECVECAAGTHSSSAGATGCDACPAHANSAAGSSECECNAGYAGSESGDSCAACTPGKFKANVGSGPCENCGSGEYSQASAAIICHDCPVGSHAEAGSAECVCNAGYTGEHESCSACQSGTYKPVPGSAACVECEAGKFSEEMAASICIDCGSNSFSTAGSTTCECNFGYSGPSSSCSACAAGKYKASSGSAACTDCDAGKFAGSTGTSDCSECGSNADSSAGSVECDCNPGYAGPAESCSACDAGKHKASPGSGACTECEAGKYSASTAAIDCSECAANADSLAGSTDCYCTPGYTGASGASCTACAAGKYKVSPGSAGCSDCQAGTFSAVAAASECTECPQHSSSVPGSTGCSCECGYAPAAGPSRRLLGTSTELCCEACAAGKFKPADGNSPCADCQSGTFSASTAASTCETCGANSDSVAGSSECTCNAGFTGTGGSCSECQAGTHKAASGSASCSECSAGTFSATSAATGCTSCAENADSSSGSTSCFCNAGYEGPGDFCTACDAGSFKANAGSGGCSECQAGKYSEDAGSIDCTVCPAHSVSLSGSSSCECDAGYSGIMSMCSACEAGKFKEQTGSAECTECAAGKFSTDVAAFDSSACLDCPAGKYSGVQGAYSEDVCIDCPAGTYHADGNRGATSAAVCTACDAGKFSSITGATDESACIGCAAGTASAAVGASDISTCSECPKNTYSSGAQSTCTACPPGSASPAGSTGEDACHFSMAMRYEISRIDYQLAANKLKAITGPYKTARDAMTTAIADYTRWLFEGGGSKPATSNGERNGDASKAATKKGAYWEALYKKQRKAETSKPFAGAKDGAATDRGRSEDQGRGRYGEKLSDGDKEKTGVKDQDGDRDGKDLSVKDTEENKMILNEASKIVSLKEEEAEKLVKIAREKYEEAWKKYELQQKADETHQMESAKKLAHEEEMRKRLAKAKLMEALLKKTQETARAELQKQEADSIEESTHGRSEDGAFGRGALSHGCGGIAGDGSLDEECEEEPTGDRERTNKKDDFYSLYY